MSPDRLARFALVLAVPFALAACGIKGPLEAPPYAAAELEASRRQTAEPAAPAQPAPTTAVSRRGASLPKTGAGVGAGTNSGAVVNTPAARQSSPLDWLIN